MTRKLGLKKFLCFSYNYMVRAEFQTVLQYALQFENHTRHMIPFIYILIL